MNIELFGFKKDGNRWVTDYSYTDNITNKYYELQIIKGEYLLSERQEWIRKLGSVLNGMGGSGRQIYRGDITNDEHLFMILIQNGVNLPEVNRHIKIEKILE
jgi:hypothetical protein